MGTMPGPRREPRCAIAALVSVLAFSTLWGCAGPRQLLFPNAVVGKPVYTRFATSGPHEGKLVIVTDAGLYYSYETRGPGGHRKGVTCAFCSLRVYVLDPTTGKVERVRAVRVDGATGKAWALRQEEELWLVREGMGAASLHVLDARSLGLLGDDGLLAARYDEVAAGIAELTAKEVGSHLLLRADALDGRSAWINVETGRQISGPDAYDHAFEHPRPFALAPESPGNPHRLVLRYDGRPVSDEVFLQGWLLHQDEVSAVVIHQESMANDARRRIARVARDGTVIWRIPPKSLFRRVHANPRDLHTQEIVLKASASFHCSKDRGAFVVPKSGILLIDYASGDVLSKIRR